MAASFSEHFKRASQARHDRNHAVAHAEFEAALAVAEAPHERAFALNGLASCCLADDQNERAIELMDQAIAACLPHPDAETPLDDRTAHALAEVCYDKGTELEVVRRDAEALAIFDESLRRFLDRVTGEDPRSDDALNLRHVVVRTLAAKGVSLHMLDHLEEALGCYDDLVRRFQGVQSNGIRKSVVRTMSWRARLYGDLGRQDKEITEYDELVARFSNNKDSEISEVVLDALERKVRIYQDQEDQEMVIDICDDTVRRFGADMRWRTADVVARMMIRRAVALGKRGEHGKELAAYDDVVRLHGESDEWMLRIHAAKALMFKAVTLNDADQSAAEIDCYDEVIRRYGEDDNEEVRAVAADALIHKGLSLGAIAEDAAEDTGELEVEPEIACYDEVMARYGNEEFVGLRRAVAEALLHKGQAMLEVGRTSEASSCLDAVIQGYAPIKDSDLQEIVADARDLKAQI
jgi:tetratricopeptide (TPR) repeat protein